MWELYIYALSDAALKYPFDIYINMSFSHHISPPLYITRINTYIFFYGVFPIPYDVRNAKYMTVVFVDVNAHYEGYRRNVRASNI